MSVFYTNQCIEKMWQINICGPNYEVSSYHGDTYSTRWFQTRFIRSHAYINTRVHLGKRLYSHKSCKHSEKHQRAMQTVSDTDPCCSPRAEQANTKQRQKDSKTLGCQAMTSAYYTFIQSDSQNVREFRACSAIFGIYVKSNNQNVALF